MTAALIRVKQYKFPDAPLPGGRSPAPRRPLLLMIYSKSFAMDRPPDIAVPQIHFV
jgi:hypothetical protein